jgi:hypothetical protein
VPGSPRTAFLRKKAWGKKFFSLEAFLLRKGLWGIWLWRWPAKHPFFRKESVHGKKFPSGLLKASSRKGAWVRKRPFLFRKKKSVRGKEKAQKFSFGQLALFFYKRKGQHESPTPGAFL